MKRCIYSTRNLRRVCIYTYIIAELEREREGRNLLQLWEFGKSAIVPGDLMMLLLPRNYIESDDDVDQRLQGNFGVASWYQLITAKRFALFRSRIN